MKICFLNGNMARPGGTERMTQLLANGLQESGHCIHVLSVNDLGKQPFYKLNVEIQYESLIKKKGIKYLSQLLLVLRLACYIRANDIDVLIVVDTALALFALPVKLFSPKIKQIYWDHFSAESNADNKHMKTFRKNALRFADGYVTLTEDDAKRLSLLHEKHCGCSLQIQI